jgi:hypothetical protein
VVGAPCGPTLLKGVNRLRATGCICITAVVCGVNTAASQQIDWDRAAREVVQLPASRFPMLPEAIRGDLERRGCTIPQASPLIYESAAQPHNVARGKFLAPNREAWAVLCWTSRAQQILLYDSGAATAQDSIGPTDHRTFLQGMGGGSVAYSHVISAATPEIIRGLHQRAAQHSRVVELPDPLDHDGVTSGYIGKGSVVYYLFRGRWMQLPGADAPDSENVHGKCVSSSCIRTPAGEVYSNSFSPESFTFYAQELGSIPPRRGTRVLDCAGPRVFQSQRSPRGG